MNRKPKWTDAPNWANHLIVQPGFNGPCFCWASSWEDGAKAIWNEDIGRDHMIFALRMSCWDYVEARPK